MTRIPVDFTVRELVLLSDSVDANIAATLLQIRSLGDKNDQKYEELMKLKDYLEIVTGQRPVAKVLGREA